MKLEDALPSTGKQGEQPQPSAWFPPLTRNHTSTSQLLLADVRCEPLDRLSLSAPLVTFPECG